MAEDDEWWNDEGGGIVGLVGYSQRAMSGARWEAFRMPYACAAYGMLHGRPIPKASQDP